MAFQFTDQWYFNLPTGSGISILPTSVISIYQQGLAFQFTTITDQCDFNLPGGSGISTISEISIYQQGSGISIYHGRDFNLPAGSGISISQHAVAFSRRRRTYGGTRNAYYSKDFTRWIAISKVLGQTCQKKHIFCSSWSAVRPVILKTPKMVFSDNFSRSHVPVDRSTPSEPGDTTTFRSGVGDFWGISKLLRARSH